MQRQDPAWLAGLKSGTTIAGRLVTLIVDEVEWKGREVHARLRYRLPAGEWWQEFSATVLEDAEVESMLSVSGFDRLLWVARNWVCAEAVP